MKISQENKANNCASPSERWSKRGEGNRNKPAEPVDHEVSDTASLSTQAGASSSTNFQGSSSSEAEPNQH
ncbi:unnamed protein product, partial [Amoebophrya sp. A120]|eukprot:GSA120T00015891001.1